LAQLTKLRFLFVAEFRRSALKGREMTAQGEACYSAKQRSSFATKHELGAKVQQP
jgi:hypothetical protein